MATAAHEMPLEINVNVNNIVNVVTGIDRFAIQPKVKHREDGMQNFFDSSKRKLASLDSQRVLSVLDDSIKKMEIVTLLPYLVENLSRFSIMLGSDLYDSLQEYDKLQRAYTNALSIIRKFKSKPRSVGNSKAYNQKFLKTKDSIASEISKDLDSGEDLTLHHAQSAVDALEKEISNNVKNIVRLFRTNPSAMNSLKDERKERASEANKILDQMYQLREQIFTRLVTTPKEEIDKHKITVQVMARQKKAQTLIKRLQVELEVTTKAKQDMIYDRNQSIRKLKSQIQIVEQETDIRNRKFLADAQKIEVAELKNSDGKKMKSQQQAIKLKQKLSGLILTHKDNEYSLRKRKYKMETEVENWIHKYDNDMDEKQTELDNITEIYNEEQERLKELEEHFIPLQARYNEIMEERKIAREIREEAEQQLRVMVKAATLIQAMWKSYRMRKALKPKTKRAKKGKGKKTR